MAARQAYEEAIRLFLETSGDDELRQLVSQIAEVGDTADEQSAIARKAFERFGQSVEDIAKVDAFAKLKQDLIATEQQLELAQAGAQELFKTFNAGDASNSGISRMQAQARKTVNDLSASVQKQRAELQQLRGELSRSGVDTTKLGSAQGGLRAKMAEAQAALAASVKSLKQFRAEQAKASADIPASNERIAKSYGKIGGALSSLRSLAAPLLAFLSFQTAKAGITNLLGVARGAEDARRALQEMYGSVDAGNRAYADLQNLAKRNGQAFDVTLESAKKLKAFGLDPLGGSLQALIDQNAAAGGSQEDLSGKVLALGQAWAKQKLQGEEILQLVERGVPVWELLSRSTGKNVQELQKLSEQGKLGRNVIAGLIEEIGKANSGAAERSLSGLSGLVAKASAAWLDFRQKIVDAGVGEYFKQQMQLLLNSTGGLDGLARKVSAAIIGVVEGIKSLGQSLAPVVSIVGNVTLSLARNADALVVLAKAYAGIKIVDFYQSMARGLITLQANATALQATNAAAVETTGIFGRLGSTIKGLPRAIGIGVVAFGIDSIIRDLSEIIRLRTEIKEIEGATAVLEASHRAFTQDRVRQGQELQRIYAQYANTVIQSNDQIKNQSLEQAEAYRQQLLGAQNYFKGIIAEAISSGQAVDVNVRESIIRVNEALEKNNAQIALTSEALRKASTDFSQFSANAVANFDNLVAKGKTVKESVGSIFDGIDFTRASGIKDAVGILDQMAARGEDAAEAIRDELRNALKEVSDADLPELKAQLDETFGAGSAGAKLLADEVASINLSRLGVDIEAIQTGFTKAGRAAVDQFKAANKEVQKLGLDMAQRSTAISQAFNNAFRAASTSTELKALKAALQEAMSGGNLGGVEFQQAVAQVDGQLAKLTGAGEEVGEGIRRGVDRGIGALRDLSSQASDTATATEQVGDAAGGSAEGMEKAAGAGNALSFSLGEISDKAWEAIRALSQSQDPLGKFGVLARAISEQRRGLAEMNDELATTLKQYDEFADRRNELRQQFDLLGDQEINNIIQAEQKIQGIQKQRADEWKRRQEEQRAADLARIEATKELARVETATAPPAQKNDETSIKIEFLPPSATQVGSVTKLFNDLVEAVAKAAAPRVIQQIERSRAISSRKRAR